MKKIYFLVLALCVFNGVNAQIVNIPDANFKALLINSSPYGVTAFNLSGNKFKIDSNYDGEIQKSEAEQVSQLRVYDSNIASLEGLQSFINLNILYCYSNSLTSLDISNNTKMVHLWCSNNKLTSLNLGSVNLNALNCSNNLLTNLDVSNCTIIANFDCSYNQLTNFEMHNVNNSTIYCSYNKLITLFIKDGLDNNFLKFDNNPNLQYICVDDVEVSRVQNLLNQYRYTNCHINSYCSFEPGAKHYTIQGSKRIDSNNNGCDVNDINYPNLKFNITNGINSGFFISKELGNYSYSLIAGNYTVTPVIENEAYFNISPTTLNVSFPTQASPFNQDFCITANGSHPDLEVTLLPLQPARPGFDAKYKIIYKNKGNTTQSGSVNLTFNDAVLDLVVTNPIASSQTMNNLSWNFTNLLPFETREITFTLNVNSPTEIPAVNNGFVLAYKTTITSAATDETPIDNIFDLNQVVVNSFDPNDKTCLEGTTISSSLIGQYVHYLIRFENKGTYPAQNIVLKDMIDLSKFDISTLNPTNASHLYTTKISDGNKVEFIFENINLPFDDANNDGYIAFKIKTKPTLVVGDSFTNEANIFFDYNFPIVTNKATSTFKTLGTQDFEFSSYFSIYPNPVNEILNIAATKEIEVKSIAVYDILGQMVLALPNVKQASKIDVSSLKTGNYFVKINTDKGTSNSKFIKN